MAREILGPTVGLGLDDEPGALAVHERAPDQLAGDDDGVALEPARGQARGGEHRERDAAGGRARHASWAGARRGAGLVVGHVGAPRRPEQVRAIEAAEHVADPAVGGERVEQLGRAIAVGLGRHLALEQPEPQEQQRGLGDVGEAVLLDRGELARPVQPLDLRAIDADLAGQPDQARDRVEAARSGRAVIGEPVAQIEVALLAVAVADALSR